MLSGKYAEASQRDIPVMRQLQPRLVWDRVNDSIGPLPGTRLSATGTAGAITDKGQYAVYMADGKTRLGELDEEFVFETTVGNVFLLGSQTWRVTGIDNDRVLVSEAPGEAPRMPFWRGDEPWRAYALGERIGRFRRAVIERIDDPDLIDWLMREYVCDRPSAENIERYVRKQLAALGVMSTDRQVLVEAFTDPTGVQYWAIHSPFGGRVNGAWSLALAGLLREKLNAPVETHVDDDGILIRLTTVGNVFDPALVRINPEEARERILRELPDSALFGARFRMNAQRALLLPGARAGKRTPFWLQRLKARDLLAAVKQFDDFPIVAETLRECLIDALDLPHLSTVLDGLRSGHIAFTQVASHAPSPLAAGLLHRFSLQYVYEWDQGKPIGASRALPLRREVLTELIGQGGAVLAGLLRDEARAELDAPTHPIGSAAALAQWLFEQGDLRLDDIAARAGQDAPVWIASLRDTGQLIERDIAGTAAIIHTERAAEYADLAFSEPVLRRWLSHTGPRTVAQIQRRYGFDPRWLIETLDRLVASGELARGRFTAGLDEDEVCDWANLERIHRRSLALQRGESRALPVQAFTHFLTRWTAAHPDTQRIGGDGLRATLNQLNGVVAGVDTWQNDLLPVRVSGYSTADLNAQFSRGDLIWVCDGRRARWVTRGTAGLFIARESSQPEPDGLPGEVLASLKQEGALRLDDLAESLGVPRAALIDALVGLALAGWVSCDSLPGLNAVLAHRVAPAERTVSALEADLAARLGGRGGPSFGQRPLRSEMRAARQRVSTRLNSDVPVDHWREPWRWMPVHSARMLGKSLSADAHAEAVAATLLQRYGVVTFDLLERESLALRWAELYPVLNRLEMRGQLRRGYFVSGLAGIQFALPDALDLLNASADDLNVDQRVSVLSAVDPALSTLVLDQARLPGTHVGLWRGLPVFVSEDRATRINIASDTPDEIVSRALAALFANPGLRRNVLVERWNDADALGGPAETWLRPFGFERTPRGLRR
jgi:ATP-dependent helicase Lhr and Lhr-like helicase